MFFRFLVFGFWGILAFSLIERSVAVIWGLIVLGMRFNYRIWVGGIERILELMVFEEGRIGFGLGMFWMREELVLDVGGLGIFWMREELVLDVGGVVVREVLVGGVLFVGGCLFFVRVHLALVAVRWVIGGLHGENFSFQIIAVLTYYILFENYAKSHTILLFENFFLMNTSKAKIKPHVNHKFGKKCH